jgi:hypothetical protein
MNSEFMYDEYRNELFRFHKYKQDWIQFDINHIPTKTNRYKKIEIDKKKFKVHRVIFYICNEDFDIFDINIIIDHADRNTGNNTSKNLSKRTHSENNQNTNRKGISLEVEHCKTKESRLKFVVNWSKDKKRYRKRVKNYYLANWLRKTKTSHYYCGIN